MLRFIKKNNLATLNKSFVKKLLFLFSLLPFILVGQNTTIIKGIVTNKQNTPIKDVAISYTGKGTVTDANGYYELIIPIRKTIRITFSHVSYKKHLKKVTLRSKRILSYSPKLTALNNKLNEVIVTNKKNDAKGIKSIDWVHFIIS